MQRSGLCGQHTINSLVQKPLFDQKELTSIAQVLYSAEKSLYFQQMSKNPYCTKFGDFSIEVIEEALKKHDIHLLRTVTDVRVIQNATAYVIQNNDHWFALRRFGDHWFDLNSLLPKPKLLPHFFIYDYIYHLKGEFTVFIVSGFPQISDLVRIVPQQKIVSKSLTNKNISTVKTKGANTTHSTQQNVQVSLKLYILKRY